MAPTLLVAVLLFIVAFFAASVTPVFFAAVAAIVHLCIDALHIDVLEVWWQVFGLNQHVGVLAFEVILQIIKACVLGISGYGAFPETCGDV